MLLMHKFRTLNTPILGHYIYIMTPDHFIVLIWFVPGTQFLKQIGPTA